MCNNRAASICVRARKKAWHTNCQLKRKRAKTNSETIQLRMKLIRKWKTNWTTKKNVEEWAAVFSFLNINIHETWRMLSNRIYYFFVYSFRYSCFLFSFFSAVVGVVIVTWSPHSFEFELKSLFSFSVLQTQMERTTKPQYSDQPHRTHHMLEDLRIHSYSGFDSNPI